MTKIDSKGSREHTCTRVRLIKTTALMAGTVNVLLVFGLFVASLVLLQRKDDTDCKEKESQSVVVVDNVRKYCFKLDCKECLEECHEVKVEGNQTLCCGNLGEHLYGIISEELFKRFRMDAAKAAALRLVRRRMMQLQMDPSSVEARSAAHVGILQNGNLTKPASEAPRVQWEKSGERAFLTGGVIHGGDRVTVTKAGYYYVYTGLQFDVDPNTVQSGAIVAYVYRNINGTKASRRKLMMARESSCRTTRNGTRGPVSMYMAGIFLLRNHDEISVRTPSQSLLHRSSATTYMGIHMV